MAKKKAKPVKEFVPRKRKFTFPAEVVWEGVEGAQYKVVDGAVMTRNTEFNDGDHLTPQWKESSIARPIPGKFYATAAWENIMAVALAVKEYQQKYGR